jgi:hypothetical protein
MLGRAVPVWATAPQEIAKDIAVAAAKALTNMPITPIRMLEAFANRIKRLVTIAFPCKHG